MSEQIERPKADIPGFWTPVVSAYSDSRGRCPVLSSQPNDGDGIRKGYLRYLIFKNNEATLQVGAVLPTSELHKVKVYPVPKEVAEQAILAAMNVVNLWFDFAKVS